MADPPTSERPPDRAAIRELPRRAWGAGAIDLTQGAQPGLEPVLPHITRAEWLSVVGVGCVVFSFNVIFLVELASMSRGNTLAAAFVLSASEYLTWLLLLRPAFLVLDRTPFRAGVRWRHGAVRLAALFALTLAYVAWTAPVSVALARAGVVDMRRAVGPFIGTVAGISLSWTLLADGASTAVLAAVTHAIIQRTHRTQRTIRWVAEVRLSAVTAQLQALALELQPHFLFNTLNGIAELLHADPRRAERMLVTLSTMLRETVETRREPLIPLATELAQLRRYLDLQQMRFGDRLRVDWDVADEALGAEVPTMLLQPLVENAVTHGLERRPGPGSIRIVGQRERDAAHDLLCLAVCDDGVGLPAEGVRQEGVGLGNTRERLRTLFADSASIVLAPGRTCGVEVTIRIPWRLAGAPASNAADDPYPTAAPGRRGIAGGFRA